MRRRNGFTLVELLVVIGIIAVLISVLMPALNAARSSAKLVNCQSNFKQIYNGVLFYTLSNKGLLPLASEPNGFGGEPMGTNCKTLIELTQMLGYQPMDVNQTLPLAPAFKCTEAYDEAGGVVWAPNLIRTIKFHPRAFPGYNALNSMPTEYPQRKLTSIRKGAEKVAFWEGAQLPTWNETSEPDSIFLDNWRWNWGHMYTDPPADGDYSRWELAIASGPNRDLDWWQCGMRFRHNKQKASPIAFFDGHVEVRRIGEVKVKEVCINK
jgi:prepilin-type N-terminal cleavage/methylation domain-containing protein/prepilin-type processing-associated H-X9-DG protein